MKLIWIAVLILIATFALAQTPSESFPPVATMKQLMVDLIHPASNDIYSLFTGAGPRTKKSGLPFAAAP